MRYQFDSCSYEELTECIHARVRWIREGEKFLKDDDSKQYGHIRTKVILGLVINRSEIRRLIKMRRVLRKSGLKNWNTDLLGDVS